MGCPCLGLLDLDIRSEEVNQQSSPRTMKVATLTAAIHRQKEQFCRESWHAPYKYSA
jgi:hypothetical protein